MANVKISALTSATFVNDADLIPIVQSGVTKKVTPAVLLENLWAETTAINGLIDTLLGAPATASLYTASGTLFNNGIAMAKDFLFKTSTDGSYNPSGTSHEMRFNGTYNDSGGFSTAPGTFGMKGAGINNKLVLFNMYGGATPTTEMWAVDTVESRTRKITLNSDGINISTEFTVGSFLLSFNDNGATMTDSRPSVFGLEYTGNYSISLATHDRSVPDVGTVKLLRQQANTWTTGTRPTAVAGVFGLNTTTSKFEGYTGSAWVDFH